MLDDMQTSVKGNDNFAIKVISKESVERKSSSYKKIGKK